ncbi:RNA polymerase, sigma-24 subunit, ECF subfamily [Alkaliphilus metalliredigens QYMF]|uniref:RNA polymerase, sigma-24 subunit, ECF subfamily n=1 Tax=Alkaliphilus metalliredigens (strain QYMF) TaxID=293826 RepID=A6TVW0_ALKMQ|nr:sigma-70 family RNA polymerase sigma factor [Alkaliphilus metalliredigens]ABR50328.1 RNA polymerase, sigma-24 subunit, ECF subfamily [Alkaliphilus metalliredigens QYMF]
MDELVKIRQAKLGDKEALVALIMGQQNEYYRLAYSYTQNKEDALDALEDMIVILYDKIHTLKKDEAFWSWSKTILVNQCKKILKNRKRTVSIKEIDQEETTDKIGETEDTMDLEQALGQLSAKHQEVIRLRYYLDLDYRSISEMTQVPLGTVKSRISVGIDKLRIILGGVNT